MNPRVLLLACVLLSGVACAVADATTALTTREQVEQLLAGELASGSSAITVARFLDAHGIAHGKPESAGPTVLLIGSVPNLRAAAPAAHITLQLRFSFLQDRLIGYSFTELAAPGAAPAR